MPNIAFRRRTSLRTVSPAGRSARGQHGFATHQERATGGDGDCAGAHRLRRCDGRGRPCRPVRRPWLGSDGAGPWCPGRADPRLRSAGTGSPPAGGVLRRPHQVRHRPHHGLGRGWHVLRRLGRLAAGVPGHDLRRALGQFRPPAARTHQRRGLRLRRQRADLDLVLRHAADLAGPPARPAQPLVRAAGLQSVLHPRRQRLPHGGHAVARICRARMVRRHLASDRLGHLFRALPADAGAPQGTPHLCGQLVLPRLHPGGGGAAHRQQPRLADLAGQRQELFAVLRRAGRDDAVVVRPQRGRLLPHLRVPGHDVLLHAQEGGAADLLLPAVDHQLLGHHLHVHVGGLAPPALHRAAAVGADPGHDLLDHAAGALLVVGRQCPAHPQWRLAPGARRRHAALHDDGGGVLRPLDLRGIVHGHPPGQLALALYRLDRRSRTCRRAGLGRDDHLRLDLRRRALAVEEAGHAFGQAGRGPLLARDGRDRHLRLRDVELRHHPGPDVADLHGVRNPLLLVHRLAGRHAPLLRRPRRRRHPVPDRGAGRRLQHLDDGTLGRTGAGGGRFRRARRHRGPAGGRV